ncbi:NAD(P)-dependent oxidoreductase [Saccharicrinis aurantiacus]|uniref:NAD(P)-dependent oxidoreductase n=1 Tax=Saccharicrinis aurantiacus TaxID=1849719 RepID=UPI002492C677|nr:NAD(P)-binding oxidoreductase [Saccharicrinis aurantiacus]
MKVLVLGASGATGKHLVEQLLINGHKLVIVVRTISNIPQHWKQNENIRIENAEVNELSPSQMAELCKECEAVALCLGHNLSWKGIYGKPRKLVLDAVKLTCKAIAINTPISPVKFVLMNTTGNRNRDLNEPISFVQKIVIALLRLLLPPHVDNEQAADYLRVEIGQNNPYVNWVAVRPDNLINDDKVTGYELYPSPIRSAIFDAGKVSRINVAHFMASLIINNSIWNKWIGKMPVIYSKNI